MALGVKSVDSVRAERVDGRFITTFALPSKIVPFFDDLQFAPLLTAKAASLVQ